MSQLDKIIKTHEQYLNNHTDIYIHFLNSLSGLVVTKTTASQDGFVLKHEQWLDDHRPKWSVAVMPMMGMIDLMAQILVQKHPGQKITSIRNAKAHTWLNISNEIEMKIDIETLSANGYHLVLKDSNGTQYCSADMFLGEQYPSSNTSTTTINKSDYEIAELPYRSHQMFHGSAFQLLKNIMVSDTGAIAECISNSPTAPFGYLNMPLLDASLHLAHTKNILKWCHKTERDHVHLPVLIESMNFYRDPPNQADILVKHQYLGTYISNQMKRFNIQIFTNGLLWCEYVIIFAGLPYDLETFSASDYYHFNEKKEYVPFLSIATFDQDQFYLSKKLFQKQNWPSGHIESVYKLLAQNEDDKVKETLIKDCFAAYLHVHPSLIEVCSDNVAKYQNNDLYFCLAEENGLVKIDIDKNKTNLINVVPLNTNLSLGSQALATQNYSPSIRLGSDEFCKQFDVIYPYAVGEMANGIAGVDIVEASAKNKILSFLGTAGVPLQKVEANLKHLKSVLPPDCQFGSNIINNLMMATYIQDIVDLYLKNDIHIASASAFMDVPLPLIQYALTGLTCDQNGNVLRKNILIPKLSRVELAEKFMVPPSQGVLQELLERNKITEQEAELASRIPIAEYITVEADSGGHTDNRPMVCLLPAIRKLADELKIKYQFPYKIKIGAAGGIGTPSSVLAAFAMGADYVLTGSVNQCTIEANQSNFVKNMLTKASMTDVMMAPAADMFEQGINVQVLKRPTMFPMRAKKLYQIYSQYKDLSSIPESEIKNLETYFKLSVNDVWKLCEEYFNKVDPKQIEKANADPKCKMALIFRWYLGNSSKWAMTGDAARQQDYQIWCGPSMGAFNDWVKGTELELLENRSVVQIAHNLMKGAQALNLNQTFSPRVL